MGTPEPRSPFLGGSKGDLGTSFIQARRPHIWIGWAMLK